MFTKEKFEKVSKLIFAIQPLSIIFLAVKVESWWQFGLLACLFLLDLLYVLYFICYLFRRRKDSF